MTQILVSSVKRITWQMQNLVHIIFTVATLYMCIAGVFTAPMKGVYYFRFYGHCHGGTTMAVSLLKNGETQCSVHSWKPTSNSNASNGVVLTLETGDQISTRLWANTWVYDDPASYTSFSGFLIFPLWMSESCITYIQCRMQCENYFMEHNSCC